MAALQALADEAPGTLSGARALVWLGDLWRVEKDAHRAAECYRRAYAGSDAEVHTRAARGLGDLAMSERKFAAAYRLYSDARASATGAVLTSELDQKIALARKGRRRAFAEWGAWVFVAAAIAGLLWRSGFWRRPRLAMPVELLYAVPVYLLFIMACLGRDPQVEAALFMFAPGSLALIGCSGLASQREPPSGVRRVAHAGLLALATAALLYAACNRAGIVDSLVFTVAS
jgi:hypothetical protein